MLVVHGHREITNLRGLLLRSVSHRRRYMLCILQVGHALSMRRAVTGRCRITHPHIFVIEHLEV